MRAGIGLAAVAFLLAVSMPATAQNYAPESLDRWFRLEWTAGAGAKGPQLSGYVYNTTNRRAPGQGVRIGGGGGPQGAAVQWLRVQHDQPAGHAHATDHRRRGCRGPRRGPHGNVGARQGAAGTPGGARGG